MKKNIIIAIIVLVTLLLISLTSYFVCQKLNFKPIKCTFGGTRLSFRGLDVIGDVIILEEKSMFFILDERNKILLDLDGKPVNNFKVEKLTKSLLSFSDKSQDSNNQYDLNRITGEIVGVGEHIILPNGENTIRFSDLYKGTCEPYKIEKKF